MKRTYNRTMIIGDLEKATVRVYIYHGTKYEDHEELATAEYTGVTSWDIIEGGEEAKEIEKDADRIDENHEYLVLHLNNGETATFRNSHVDMFIR